MILPGTALGQFGRVKEPDTVYRHNPAITNSSMNLFLANEWLYKKTIIDREWQRPDTGALIFGRGFHAFVLETEVYRSTTAIWTGAVRRGKEWEAFKNANLGKTLLTEDESDLIGEMGRSIAANSKATALIGECEAEVTFRHNGEGTDHGLARQCRVDGISPFGVAIDLKSTDNLKDFRRNFCSYGYHRQAVWYQDMVELVTGSRPAFKFIAVEKKEPYAVGIYAISPKLEERARNEIQAGLTRLGNCLKTDIFQRDPEEVQVIDDPREWAVE